MRTYKTIAMSRIRFDALNEAFGRRPLEVQEKGKRSELFGRNVFNEHAMRQYLTKDAFRSV